MKYVPQGKRGVALGVAHDNYRGGAVMDKLAAANERITFFAQIETGAGVENADALAAMDGVDCLWVGHFDLSCSLGIPGDFENKIFKDAIKQVLAACKKHKKAAGRLVPDVATGVDLYKQGFDFVCYAGDVWVFQAALKAGVGRHPCRRREVGSRPWTSFAWRSAATSASPTASRPIRASTWRRWPRIPRSRCSMWRTTTGRCRPRGSSAATH